MSRREQTELINETIDKLHLKLSELPEVISEPVFAKGTKLRKALAFLRNQLDIVDSNSTGYITVKSMIILFSSGDDSLNYLTAHEAHYLTRYVMEQSGQSTPETQEDELA